VVLSLIPAGKFELISKPDRKYEKPLPIVPAAGAAR
jgi:hypothetical protein